MSTDLPAVHLVRERANLGQRRLVRMQRQQCIDERRIFSRIKRESPDAWSRIRQERPTYDPGTPLAADPEWSKVAVLREEEFFDGRRYAVHSRGHEYGISQDGSCALEATRRESREIDDGNYAWSINDTERTIARTRSAARLREQADAELQAGLDVMPGSREVIAGLLAQAGLFGAVGAAEKAIRKKESKTIAGQPAECVAMDEQELCYWQRLPMYPGAVERPVILRSVVVFAGSRNIAEASHFRVLSRIPASVFELPKGYKPSGHADASQ